MVDRHHRLRTQLRSAIRRWFIPKTTLQQRKAGGNGMAHPADEAAPHGILDENDRRRLGSLSVTVAGIGGIEA